MKARRLPARLISKYVVLGLLANIAIGYFHPHGEGLTRFAGGLFAVGVVSAEEIDLGQLEVGIRETATRYLTAAQEGRWRWMPPTSPSRTSQSPASRLSALRSSA